MYPLRDDTSDDRPLIACVGHCAIDHVFQIADFPERATKTPAHRYQSVGGGMAANAALACARLGARVRFVGAVGPDDAGRMVRGQLAAEGIDLTHLQEVPGTHTSASAIIVDRHGERHIFNHRGNALAGAQVPDDSVFEGCDAVLTDPRWPAGARGAWLWAGARGRLSVFDADVAPQHDLAALVPLAQWVVFSEPGLAVWSGAVAQETALMRAIYLGAICAAVTLGDQGVALVSEGRLRRVSPFPVRAVDTTGAGDVFHGALTLALARGMLPGDACSYASAAAALKCTQADGIRGAPTAGAVEDFLRERR
jgi:sulfofructose kinase